MYPKSSSFSCRKAASLAMPVPFRTSISVSSLSTGSGVGVGVGVGVSVTSGTGSSIIISEVSESEGRRRKKAAIPATIKIKLIATKSHLVFDLGSLLEAAGPDVGSVLVCCMLLKEFCK